MFDRELFSETLLFYAMLERDSRPKPLLAPLPRRSTRTSRYALNRHILPGPDTNTASSTFGFITSPQGNTPRNVQLGMKFYF